MKTLLVPFALMLFCGIGVSAQPTAPQSGAANLPYWATMRWTDSDAPWAKERRSLEDAPATQLASILAKEPTKPNVVPSAKQWFRYGTAAYLLTTKWKRDRSRELIWATVWSNRTQAPLAPTFVRLQFLLDARGIPQPNLKEVGLRLAQRDPKDYDVRFFLCKMLVPDEIPANKPLAIRLCNEMQRLAPKRASGYSVRGDVHFRCWLAQRDSQDRQASVAAYNRYLQLAPPSDSFRPQAKRLIALMNANAGARKGTPLNFAALKR